MSEAVYIVLGSKSWNRRLFEEQLCRLPGQWHFLGKPEELTTERIVTLKPRYLFFLHWSWKVPAQIVEQYECVCFHMTDVPFGRGGSPLQNLILRGLRETKLTALRMTETFDAGPVYLKVPLALDGSAEEILIRATELSGDMIKTILYEQPRPIQQIGEPTVFKRRQPEQSLIPARETLPELHDFIRMLDGEGYPRAFITHQGYRYEFSRAVLGEGRMVANVTILPEMPSQPTPCP